MKNFDLEHDQNIDIAFMQEALLEARKALAKDESPIGCVIVKDGQIIGRGHNTTETDDLALSHAEINAIKQASQKMGWRLEGTSMYITMEPCAMCAGAIVRSRIDRVIIGLRDPKRGCAGSRYNLLNEPAFNHQAQVSYDILSQESLDLLQSFFREKRQRSKT